MAGVQTHSVHRHKQPKLRLAGEIANPRIGAVVLPYLAVQLHSSPLARAELGGAAKSEGSILGEETGVNLETWVQGHHNGTEEPLNNGLVSNSNFVNYSIGVGIRLLDVHAKLLY